MCAVATRTEQPDRRADTVTGHCPDRAEGCPDGNAPVKKPMSSPNCCGKSSSDSASTLRRSARAVFWSVPGARPSPRSMRPGWSAASVPNCSATTNGGWLGSITPPEPTRMRSVDAAMSAMRTLGADEAIPGMLWCSASQNRVNPSRSTWRASSRVPRSASAAERPETTGREVEHGQGYGGEVGHARGNVSGFDVLPVGPQLAKRFKVNGAEDAGAAGSGASPLSRIGQPTHNDGFTTLDPSCCAHRCVLNGRSWCYSVRPAATPRVT